MEEIKELDLTKLETVAGGTSGEEAIHFKTNIYKGTSFLECFSSTSHGNVSARAIKMAHAHRTGTSPEKVHVSLLDGPEFDYEKDLAANGISEGSIVIVVIDE